MTEQPKDPIVPVPGDGGRRDAAQLDAATGSFATRGLDEGAGDATPLAAADAPPAAASVAGGAR
jgi:hypothetical protein